jgi:regulatory protein YycI of two-component signal transduction system YycFG
MEISYSTINQATLQSDGNLVIYNSSNSPIWATYTIHNPDHLAYINTTFPLGKMYPGQSIDTADRRFHLILQRDGNLVLYSPTKALWASGTDGKMISFLAMQRDGNLVLYDRSYRPLWYSGTAGFNLARLIIQQDGNLVLYSTYNQPLWNTATSGAL